MAEHKRVICNHSFSICRGFLMLENGRGGKYDKDQFWSRNLASGSKRWDEWIWSDRALRSWPGTWFGDQRQGRLKLGSQAHRSAFSRGGSRTQCRKEEADWESQWGTEQRRQGPRCQCRRCERCGLDPWVGRVPWRRKCQPTGVFLPWRAHGQRSLVSCSLRSPEESDTTERRTLKATKVPTERGGRKPWFPRG